MGNYDNLGNNKKLIVFFAQQFPNCFKIKGEVRPLKIGIFKDLVERIKYENNLSKTQIRSALRIYTSSWRYLYSMKVGAFRVDLDGKNCDIVDIKHVEYAYERLKEAKVRIKTQSKRKYQNTDDKNKPLFKREYHYNNEVIICNIHSLTKESNIYYLKNNSLCTLQNIDNNALTTSMLYPGQSIIVKTGKNLIKATILKITKNGFQIQLKSGIAMFVRVKHVYC